MSCCARCPRLLGRSCCEVDDGEQLATLTDADVRRIEEATGQRGAVFTEVEWLSVEAAHAYEERRPLYRGYFRAGPGRLTLRRRQGACVFLDRQHGCRLAAELRPTACRLYPFELWPDESWSLAVDRHGGVEPAKASGQQACLAVEEASSIEELLAVFAVTREEIEALGRRLRAEVSAHGRARGRPR